MVFLSNYLVFKIVLAALGRVDYPVAGDLELKYDTANKIYLSGGSLDYVDDYTLYTTIGGETTTHIIPQSPRIDFNNETKLTGEATGNFGSSVSIDGDYLAITDSFYHSNDYGKVYIYHRSGTTWSLQNSFESATSSDYMNAVALSGDYLMVGVRYGDNVDTNAGEVLVYKRSGTTWTNTQTLTASDGANADNFGSSITLKDNCAVVGTDNVSGAYVFTLSNGTWSETQLLTTGTNSDLFGHFVNLSDTDLLIGARGVNSLMGTAYIYTNNGGTFTQQAQITPDDLVGTDWFGQTGDIFGDYACVCAPYQNTSTGAAYIFKRSGKTWTQQQKLTASNSATNTRFGYGVHLMSDDTVIIGAYNDDAKGANAGAAYLFQRTGDTWSEIKIIYPSDIGANDFFGRSISSSETDLVISGPTQDNATGNVYLFPYTKTRNFYITDAGKYSVDATIAGLKYKTNEVEVTGSVTPKKSFNETIVQTITSSDGGFGICSIDGDYSVIGATGYDTNKGAVYVFYRSNGIWAQQARIVSNDYSNSINFGNSVAISGDRVIVGQSSYSSNSGKVEIFHRSGISWTHVSSFTGSGSDQLGKLFVDIDGDYAIAGSLGYNTNTGRLYIYHYSNGSWAQQYTLDGESTYDEFGVVASISGDYIIVGARFDDDGGLNAGAAYIYKRTNTTWNLQNKFIGESASDDFGYGVAIYNEYAAIAAPGTTNGRLYIYKRTDTTWNIISKLDGPYTGSMGFDGYISMTDEYIIIGDHNNNITFVYRRSGETWSLTNELTGSGLFGKGVDISSSNDVIIGSHSDKNCKLYSTDPVAGLTFDNYNKLSLTNTPTNTSSKLFLGSNVYDIGTLTSDLTIETPGLYRGARFDTSSNVAYFSNETTVGAIASTMAGYEADTIIYGTVQSGASHGTSQGGFGNNAILNADGTRLLVTDPLNYPSGRGRAYIYHLESGSWVLKQTWNNPNNSGQRFADGVCMNEDGTRVFLMHSGSEKVYTYEYASGAWPTANTGTHTISPGTIGGEYEGMACNKAGDVLLIGQGNVNTAKIYRRASATSWSQDSGGSFSKGRGVAMNGAGTRAFIGNSADGTVHMTEWNGNTWSSLTQIIDESYSSWPCTMMSDSAGETLVIKSGTSSGHADSGIYERDSGTGSWSRAQGVNGHTEIYGMRLPSISYDGTMVLVGQYRYDNDKGRAQLWQKSGGSWSLTKEYLNPKASPATDDYWGGGTGIARTTKDKFVISMEGDDTAGTEYGSVHIYTNAIPDFISFDTYNKLSLSGITNPTSKIHALPTGAESTTTYDIGSATNIYIESAGTYTAEMKGSSAFALDSNVTGTVNSPPTYEYIGFGGMTDLNNGYTTTYNYLLKLTKADGTPLLYSDIETFTILMDNGNGTNLDFTNIFQDTKDAIAAAAGQTSTGWHGNGKVEVTALADGTALSDHATNTYIAFYFKLNEPTTIIDGASLTLHRSDKGQWKNAKAFGTNTNPSTFSSPHTPTDWTELTEVTTVDAPLGSYNGGSNPSEPWTSLGATQDFNASAPGRHLSLTFDGYNKYTFTGADTGSTYKLKYESNTYDLGTISNVYIAHPGTYSAEIKGATNFALSSNVTGNLGTYLTLHDNVAISHTTGGGQTLVTVNNIKGNKTYKISFNKQWTDSHASYSTRLKMYIKDSSDGSIRNINSIGDYLNSPRDGILLYDAGGAFDESAMIVGTGFSVDGGAGTHTVEITGGTYGSTSSPFTLADPWYFLITMSTSDVITGKFFVGDTEVISHFLTRKQSGDTGTIGETGNKFVFEFHSTATISGVNMTVEEYNPAPKLDFDGYNKLTFSGLESGSTSNVTFDGNTYSIGTASNVYIPRIRERTRRKVKGRLRLR